MLFSIFDALRIFEALQIFFNKFLLKWEKNEVDFESRIFFEAQNIILFLNLDIPLFFKWSKSQRCFDVAQRCSIQRWNTQRCFSTVERCKFQRWRIQRCFNIDMTLCSIAVSYQPKNNVEPTLKCVLGVLCISSFFSPSVLLKLSKHVKLIIFQN